MFFSYQEPTHYVEVVEKVVFVNEVEGITFEQVDKTAADYVYDDLGTREGVGDNLTEVITGEYGVTEAAREAVQASPDLSDRDVALVYLKLLESKWEPVEGFRDAPVAVKEALLDATYNMGPSVMYYDDLREALALRHWTKAVEALLDTANVKGKSVKGLAIRRAELYNYVADRDITHIEQMKDGRILYKRGNDIIFEYKPKGGKHEKSRAGSVALDVDGV